MIHDAAPFSLRLFRQILRNDLDQPGVLQHLRRWTTAPSFYINTYNPRTGRDIVQRELDVIVNGIRIAVPQATGGRFEAGVIETGSGERPEQPNVINIEIMYDPNENICGKALVGGTGSGLTMSAVSSSVAAKRLAPTPSGTKSAMPWAFGITTMAAAS
jgi:hypothetical protein